MEFVIIHYCMHMEQACPVTSPRQYTDHGHQASCIPVSDRLCALHHVPQMCRMTASITAVIFMF